MKTEPLTHRVIGAAMKVHRLLGCGFLESVYRNAMAIELEKSGFSFDVHPALSVRYEGEEVGVFQADLIIEGQLIVELKAVETLAPVHSSQLINYLAAAEMNKGLLLNFGGRSLQFRTKTKDAPQRLGLDQKNSLPVNWKIR